MKNICLHAQFVILARLVKEGLGYSPVLPGGMTTAQEDNQDATPEAESNISFTNTMKIQRLRKIPSVIPCHIVARSDHMNIIKGQLFEPKETKCLLCGNELSKGMYAQGTSSENGNGFFISNKTAFISINIKLKKCQNKLCKATTVLFPYNEG